MAIAPYPWHALASTTREGARAAQGLRHALERLARLGELGRAIGELTQARVEVLVRSIAAGGAAAGDGIGVLVARADEPLEMCLVELEPALATTLAARALRRKAPAIVDVARDPGENVAGAAAAILLAAARRAHVGVPLVVRGAGPARALAGHLGADVTVASLTVLVDDDAYLARAAVPRVHAASARRGGWSSADLAALGDTRLSMPVVACATLATVADVASLRRGDAWLPGEWPLSRPSAGKIAGPVTLAAPRADGGLRATLGEDGRLVVLGDRVELAMEDDRTVQEAMAQAMGDVPVVVRVEIGAAEMLAREWAAIGKGDVVALGTKIADPVVLRVGGVEVARGELVEIDGEVGVRILSRRDGAAR